MKLLQTLLSTEASWTDLTGDLSPEDAGLVLVFGLRATLAKPALFDEVRKRFPNARVVMVSTAGNLADIRIEDEQLVCTALCLERATLRCASARLETGANLDTLCQLLGSQLNAPDLRHVLVFSDGSLVNGSTLIAAFNQCLPEGVTLSGGLAGDGTDFASTLVGLDSPPTTGVVVAVGLYGESLRLGFGSAGGWSTFGPSRTVTASANNVLSELDGQPALELYRAYLGPEADALPAAALRFPLSVVPPHQTKAVVRTILSIDDDAGTMTFAGDIPKGASVRFMRASYEELVNGAEEAARQAVQASELVICVSCVGRRVVLGERTEEELEGVRSIFGQTPVLTGFYSYGELAPSGHEHACQLHNQTMTITSLAEELA